MIADRQLTIEGTITLPIQTGDIPQLIKPKGLVVGLRAEYLTYCAPNAANLVLSVASIEQLGNETLVTFQVGDKFWTAKWLGQWQLSIGERVPLKLDINHLNFYDQDSGQLLQAQQVNQSIEVIAQ